MSGAVELRPCPCGRAKGEHVRGRLHAARIFFRSRRAVTNDDIAEVGKALLPYLRDGLTAAELGACAYNATMALRRAQNRRAWLAIRAEIEAQHE